MQLEVILRTPTKDLEGAAQLIHSLYELDVELNHIVDNILNECEAYKNKYYFVWSGHDDDKTSTFIITAQNKEEKYLDHIIYERTIRHKD